MSAHQSCETALGHSRPPMNMCRHGDSKRGSVLSKAAQLVSKATIPCLPDSRAGALHPSPHEELNTELIWVPMELGLRR